MAKKVGSRWRRQTYEMTRAVMRHKTVRQISEEAGVEYWWLRNFLKSEDGNETIVRTNRLHDYVRGYLNEGG